MAQYFFASSVEINLFQLSPPELCLNRVNFLYCEILPPLSCLFSLFDSRFPSIRVNLSRVNFQHLNYFTWHHHFASCFNFSWTAWFCFICVQVLMQLKIFKMFAVETSHGDKTKKSFKLLSGVFHTVHFFFIKQGSLETVTNDSWRTLISKIHCRLLANQKRVRGFSV